jgi:hypothetical protein
MGLRPAAGRAVAVSVDRAVRLVSFAWVNDWHSGTAPEDMHSTVRAFVELTHLKGKPVVSVDIGDEDAHELLEELVRALGVCARVRVGGGGHVDKSTEMAGWVVCRGD